MIEEKEEFLSFALKPGCNISELCRRYGISRKSAYALINRYQKEGMQCLDSRSKKPHHSPNKTPIEVEALILENKKVYCHWGARKIRNVLVNGGHKGIPAVSTVAAIFERNGIEKLKTSSSKGAWKRYERDEPNQLWQMDFKGHVPVKGARSHPLTIVDDHSRYCIALRDCRNEQGESVKSHLISAFQCYGLPDQILCDNGKPWGNGASPNPHNALSVWLLRLGVRVLHGKPYHPQTQGKNERFNQTLKVEVLNDPLIPQLSSLQEKFDTFRYRYNHIRPHESVDDLAPISRYTPSQRSMPTTLPALEYLHTDIVKKVKSKGEITFRNQFYYIGSPFSALPIALRQTHIDGLFDVFFGTLSIGQIDLNEPKQPKAKYQLIR